MEQKDINIETLNQLEDKIVKLLRTQKFTRTLLAEPQ